MLAKFDANESYQICMVKGSPFMFSDLRVDRDSVPAGLFVYDIADGDGDGCFARIQPHVLVNHWGTIIGKQPLDLGPDSVYYPKYGTAEYEGTFIDEMTLQEYMGNEDWPEPEEETDGEYLMKAGSCYAVKVSCCQDVCEEDIRNALEEALEEGDLRLTAIDHISKQGGFWDISLRVEVLAEPGVRTFTVCDILSGTIDFYNDDPMAVPVKKGE